MRVLLFSASLVFCTVLFSQSWPGYETGQYAGISTASMRPGSMATSPYKVDATVIGAHLYSKTEDLFKNKEAINQIFSGGLAGINGFSQLNENRTQILSNLQFPSALVGINPKLSVGFVWNMRFMWSSEASDQDVNGIFNPDSGATNIDRSGASIVSNLNCWNELGIGAGGVVWEKPHHSISTGGFFKLVFGAGNLDVNINNVDVKVTGDTIESMSFDVNILVSEQAYDLVDQGNLDLFEKAGVGFDLGAEYRYSKSATEPASSRYLYKVGFALNDLGTTRYKSGLTYSQLKVSGENIYVDRFRDIASFEELIDTLTAVFDVEKSTTTNYNIPLPLSLRLYGDYNLKKNISLFSEFHMKFFNMLSKAKELKTFYEYNITPRYEDEQYGVYLPVSFTNAIPASVGVSLRWKPFIIGSSNIFTFWAYDNRKFLDVFLKAKIPVLYKEERVRYQKKMKKIHPPMGEG